MTDVKQIQRDLHDALELIDILQHATQLHGYERQPYYRQIQLLLTRVQTLLLLTQAQEKLKVYVIANKQTDAIATGRIFSSAEAADKGLMKLVSWVASEADIRRMFEVTEVEVES